MSCSTSLFGPSFPGPSSLPATPARDAAAGAPWPPVSVPPGAVAIGFQHIVELATGCPVAAELYSATSARVGDAWHHAPHEEMLGAAVATLDAVAAGRSAELGCAAVNLDPRLVELAPGPLEMSVIAAAGTGLLTIEVLETAPVSEQAARRLANWRRRGALVVLDDYRGAGDEPRLEYLEVDGVKLDRHLVSAAAAGDATAVRRIADVVSRWTLVVAEGVEDAHTAAVMADLGVARAQGWWFHRPEALEA
jgi:hypothetical protein